MAFSRYGKLSAVGDSRFLKVESQMKAASAEKVYGVQHFFPQNPLTDHTVCPTPNATSKYSSVFLEYSPYKNLSKISDNGHELLILAEILIF